MKAVTCLAIFCLTWISVFAQKDKDIPAFGKIDKADLEMTTCEFDKEADVIKLLETCNMEYQKGNHWYFALKIEKRVRLKILKPQAVDRANIKLYYITDDNYEKMYNVDASTYNLDPSGKIVEIAVDKKSFYKEKVNSNISALKFSFPDVKAGSILEYRYTIVRENLGHIDPWYFQDSIPTRMSYLRFAVPEYFKFTTNANLSRPLDQKKDEYRTSIDIERERIEYKNNELIYKMKDIPGLKYEPFMSARRDYLQRIIFQLSSIEFPNTIPQSIRNTWPLLAKSLREHPSFGSQISKNLMKNDAMNQLLANAKTPEEKMSLIFRHVQKTMDWSGVHDFYCNNVKESWASKKGSSGDINLILINMLKDADLDASPMLVSTRDHGQIQQSYPFLEQFNNVVVLVIIGEQAYVLDASDPTNCVSLIPESILGTQAFVVDPRDHRFVTLWSDNNSFTHYITIDGSIDEEGNLSGECQLNSQDYARNIGLHHYKAGKEKYISRFIKADDFKITDLAVENDKQEQDSLPFYQTFKFSCPVNSSGDYKYFSVNLFSNLGKNPFTADNRTTDIDFGYNQHYIFTGKISIPDGYEFETPPKTQGLIMPDTSISFRRYVEIKGNTAGYRITLDFKRPVFGADEYPAIKEFYKLLFDKLNEQFVFRKKS